MQLSDYFENHEGLGVLATADQEGRVNAAIYARPHFMEDGTIAFIMRDRLTHRNLKFNPYATYLFVEKSSRYQGKRLYLKKVGEEKDTELLYELRRRTFKSDGEGKSDSKFLVFFELDRDLPLVTRLGEQTDVEF
jgi:hypothetical protein